MTLIRLWASWALLRLSGAILRMGERVAPGG